MLSNEMHSIDVKTSLSKLQTSQNGLCAEEAAKRLEANGKNKLLEKKPTPLLVRFLMQFKNAMIIVLLGAALISAAFGEFIDLAIILFVVILNAILGVSQESKAEKAIKSLQNLTAQTAKVRRAGEFFTIASEELVVGDIVLLEAGDNVPADLRLIESHNLQIEEAALTGESIPSEKHVQALTKASIAIGDKKNMAFSGTTVVYGRGEGVVCEIGMQTQMGKIAEILGSAKEEATPLQKQMDKLGKTLSFAILVICSFIFILNIANYGTSKEKLVDSFLTAVSLAVAAIPEGLAAVITLIMSIGVTRMSKRNAIIRKLPSIETLGCASVICSDKTGTLTQNKMSVQSLFCLGEEQLAKKMLMLCGLLCNDSHFEGEKICGDPTEIALTEYMKNHGFFKQALDIKHPRQDEVPFDSKRKLMSTLNAYDKNSVMFCKGATEEILVRCTKYIKNGQPVELTADIRQEIMRKNLAMTQGALRVLGFAYKNLTSTSHINATDENDLVFLGLCGMLDPIRPEVFDAIKRCKRAKILPIMITGDHKITAVAIAKQLSIIQDESEAILGSEIDKMTDTQLAKALHKYKVYARVSPQNKVRIVQMWKARGKIVAMTGDGVNDAPALKIANIGVGMGIAGTDVTKNVADIVLSDDNFNTIVVAVEEGRVIYSNIKKTVQFLLSSNICEVLTLLIASLIGFRILSAVQILWVNLVTDTFPALALGLEKSEEDIMEQPPRDIKQGLFADGTGISMVYQSLYLTALVMIGYCSGRFLGTNPNMMTAQTMAFAILSLSQIAHSFNLKSAKHTVLNSKLLDNKALNIGAIAAFLLITAMIYTPKLNELFGLVPLNAGYMIIVVLLSFAIIPLVEITKLGIEGAKRLK